MVSLIFIVFMLAPKGAGLLKLYRLQSDHNVIKLFKLSCDLSGGIFFVEIADVRFDTNVAGYTASGGRYLYSRCAVG